MDNAINRGSSVLQRARSQHITRIHNGTPEKGGACPAINARIKTSLFLFIFMKKKRIITGRQFPSRTWCSHPNNNITVLKSLLVSSSGNNYG
ncbi:hypothetical protein HF730_002043 [Salmonella enterica]|nr:hypothetical protein [Salmonella enterica]